MLKIVADAHIPFLKGALEPYARVVYLEGSQIGRQDVEDADALIVRTRTRCDKALLEGTSVQFIATATIGFDHIDTAFCAEKGIAWHHAPGCNAGSVKQYIASALAYLYLHHGIDPEGKTMGIIGVGNVGSKVAELANAMGMATLLNDPPRANREGPAGFAGMDEIREKADIVTLHVPLTYDGPYKTHHLADAHFLSGLARRPVLINTSRGEVVQGPAIPAAMEQGHISGFLADVWENEPYPDPELLNKALIATPHIAGYSVEGKANGTAACVRAASRHFGLGLDDWYPGNLPSPAEPLIRIATGGKLASRVLAEAILKCYDIQADDASLRSEPQAFEKLRNYYPPRREFGAYRILLEPFRQDMMTQLESIGFAGG
jgi:erythronate-4-phosphate dehydrogenase